MDPGAYIETGVSHIAAWMRLGPTTVALNLTAGHR